MRKFPFIELVVVALTFLLLKPNIVWAQGPGGSGCSQASNCTEIQIDENNQSGSFTVPTYITEVTLKIGQTIINVDPANGNYVDDCYTVNFSSSIPQGDIDTAEFSKIGGEECQDISHVEVWWYVSPTGIVMKEVSVQESRSLGYIIGIPIVIFILAFGTWWLLYGRFWWKRFRGKSRS